MRVLQPNIDEDFVPIFKQHIYVCATDTKQKLILKEILIAPGQHTWEWISLRTDQMINISGIKDRYCSFDNAINKAINNSYSTVYELDGYEEMISKWDSLKYIDSITTVYTSENNNERI